jgi:hypothetical protein
MIQCCSVSASGDMSDLLLLHMCLYAHCVLVVGALQKHCLVTPDKVPFVALFALGTTRRIIGTRSPQLVLLRLTWRWRASTQLCASFSASC